MTETKMQLVDWLDDLCVRFIINLPREELESVERICFQVEEAQWFYEDFIRPLDPMLPSLNLKQFCLKIFQHCPLFSVYDAELHLKAFSEFLAYKTRVPVRGAILLNEPLDEVVLVKGYKKGSSWSFPRGKINKDEKDIDCAIREVYEETGYDVRGAGLLSKEEDVKSIDITMREQNMKLFVFPGVPRTTHFEPRTRKEISKIEWYKLSDLPTLKKMKQQQHQQSGPELAKNANKFYMVAPFLVPLKKYIAQLRKKNGSVSYASKAPHTMAKEVFNDYMSVPIVDTEPLPTNKDMERLMAQLRQSQQASRENNFPEVTDPVVLSRDASLQLKQLLNVQSTTSAAETDENHSAAAFKSKANAMLSLLRGQGKTAGIETLSSDPHEQFISQEMRPPSSPRHQTSRTEREPSVTEPPAFHFPPSRVSHGDATRPELSTNAHAMSPVAGAPQKHFAENVYSESLQSPEFQRQTAPAHTGASMPDRWTGDAYFPSQFSRNSQLTGERQHIGPPASKLPMPKLNAHSSALLNLFKGTQTGRQPEQTLVAQLPAENPLNPLELATSRPTTVTQSQLAFNKPTLSDVIGSSSALMSSSPSATAKSTPRPTSQHQENLLNLFKSSTLAGKSSPSLIPPPAPVELAANQLDVPKQIPEFHRHDTRDNSTATLDPSRIILKKRPKESIDLTRPNLSATVTGPLNVPQFENVQKSSAKKPHPSSQKQTLPVGSNGSQPPIRILARPASSHKSNSESDEKSPKPSGPRGSLRQTSDQSRTTIPFRDSPRPFQPQILKRPTEAMPTKRQSIEPPPPQQPQKILTRPAPSEDSSQSRTLEQKAALLSLFRRSNTNISSEGVSTGFPVSPLSEKPAVESGLVSPTGVGRSRIGSIQSAEGETSLGEGRQKAKVMASPQEKQFLLKFLDEVASEGRS